MRKKIRRILVNYVTKHLFYWITEDDILRVSGNKVIHRGHVLTDDEKKRIISQAKSIDEMELWRLLLLDMKYLANKKIVLDSLGDDDVVKGKMVLWTIDLIEKKIESLKNLNG